ncbi:MAG: hypothetical protein V7739_08930 [Motiliproteus sp.]
MNEAKGLFSVLREDLPEDYANFLEKWDAFKKLYSSIISEYDPKDPVWAGFSKDRISEKYSRISLLDARIEKNSWSWGLITKEKAPSAINRLGSLINGPIFTCAGYEWPMCERGYPRVPILQIDLDLVCKKTTVDLGGGLLQWFESSNELGFFRTIPQALVNVESLLPIPDFPEKSDLQQELIDPEWIDEGDDVSYFMPCQITGYRKKKFKIAEMQLEWFYENYVPEAHRLNTAFEEKLEEIYEASKKLYKKYPVGQTCLFGTFHPIQEEPEDFPTPLLCLEQEFGLQFGDGGNAQVFCEHKEGVLDYFYMQSCY